MKEEIGFENSMKKEYFWNRFAWF